MAHVIDLREAQEIGIRCLPKVAPPVSTSPAHGMMRIDAVRFVELFWEEA
jgi:hypothetical protein